MMMLAPHAIVPRSISLRSTGPAARFPSIRMTIAGAAMLVPYQQDQIIAVHTQINSIETQPRAMKHGKLQDRVADLEEKVFGESRA
jgi:hypothetical protein